MGDIRYLYGKRVCQCVIENIPVVEHNLREIGAIKTDLSGMITQGGYNKGGVTASAGTHDRGGVLDVRSTLVDNVGKLRAWREAGWFMSDRLPSEGSWPRHGHGVLVGCPHVSSGARSQVESYRRGRNGLRGQGPDRGPRVPIVTWREAVNNYNAEFSPIERLLESMDENDLKNLVEDSVEKAMRKNTVRQGFWSAMFRRYFGDKAETTVANIVYSNDMLLNEEVVPRIKSIESKVDTLMRDRFIA